MPVAFGKKKPSRIGRDVFYVAATSDKYFPSQVGDYKKEFHVETNPDMEEQDWENLHTQHKFTYEKKTKKKNFGIEVIVTDWSGIDSFLNRDVMIYPIEAEAQMKPDPYDSPSVERSYRVGTYFVNEKDSKADYKPSSVIFYFKNGINVQLKSYQLGPKEMIEIIKKTSLEKIGDI